MGIRAKISMASGANSESALELKVMTGDQRIRSIAPDVAHLS